MDIQVPASDSLSTTTHELGDFEQVTIGSQITESWAPQEGRNGHSAGISSSRLDHRKIQDSQWRGQGF